jgi:hypothetical protein
VKKERNTAMQNVFQTQEKKSKLILILRILLGVLLICGGIAGQVIADRVNEAGRVIVDAAHPLSEQKRGTLVMMKSDRFIWSGLYTGKSSVKPKTLIYFVPVYDKAGDLVEVIVVASSHDHRNDESEYEEDRPVREFKGVTGSYDVNYNKVVEALMECDFTEEEVQLYLPDTYVQNKSGSTAYWLLAIPGMIALIINGGALKKHKKNKARMAAYGMDDMALARFDQEYTAEQVRLGKVTLTQNWLFDSTAASTVLLPLKEVLWLYGTVTQHRTNGIPTGKTYTAEVRFSDGESLKIRSRKGSLDGVIAQIAQRCPQALVGFSVERKAAWEAKNYAAFRKEAEQSRVE